MAPHTGEGTAFQEDRRADPWPVMDGEFLDVEDETVGHVLVSNQGRL